MCVCVCLVYAMHLTVHYKFIERTLRMQYERFGAKMAYNFVLYKGESGSAYFSG